MIYTTSQFLDDLKDEINKLSIERIITNEIISELLTGKKGRHYESKKTMIKKYDKIGKNYLISKEVITEYKKNLKSHFKDKYNYSQFEDIFNRYVKCNPLKKYMSSTINNNPNLKLDYFKVIDSKEKAYWLGWIFAEGHINKHKGLAIEIGFKDRKLVLRFANDIGFEQSNLIYKKRVSKERSILKSILINFQNSRFTDHLLDKGLISGKKSAYISLPNLDNDYTPWERELYLAFLLGFFDGDGQQGSSRIFSNSYKFLRQIKEKFNLDSRISQTKYITKNLEVKSKYSMFLTAKLFNEMLSNYKVSLKRKRVKLVDTILRAEQLKEARAMRKIKFMFSKNDLQKLLFKMPRVHITKLHQEMFGIKIGRTTIYRYAKKWNLTLPSANYWKQKKYIPNPTFSL